MRPQFDNIAVIQRTMSDDCVIAGGHTMAQPGQNRFLEIAPVASGTNSSGPGRDAGAAQVPSGL
jgi:hypothetical protein